MQDKAVPVLGVVGALAAGKSTVSTMLADRGAAVVNADRIGHSVLERPEVCDALVERFGPAVLDPSGRINRSRLAEAVFGDPERVAALNGIMLGPIIRQIRAEVAELKLRRDVPLVVLDASLLVETGLDEELCDAMLFVDAPDHLRRRRAADYKGLSADQFDKRQQAQLEAEKKRERADLIVSNSGSRRELRKQVDQLWPKLCA